MASKHYIIATQTGYLDGEFHSKAAAVKALAEEVKIAVKECRRSYKRCSVVGSARSGSVQIKVGGRQGYHLWQRYVINERPGARKPPREAAKSAVAGEVHHATRKKSRAQLDREIAEVVPGWAKGLDLSESRELAKRLHVSQEELEAKERRGESDRRAALPSLAITDTGNGVFVRVSSPGPGYGKYNAVVDALKAFQLPIGNAIPPNIFVPVHKAADKTKARTKVEEALRYAGYRV